MSAAPASRPPPLPSLTKSRLRLLRRQASVRLLVLPEGAWRAWRRLSEAQRHAACEAARQLLLLAEKVLSWLTGCAWTDVATSVFPTLSMVPSPLVLGANTACALALSALAVAWLVVTGEDPTTVPWNEVLHREDVE